MIVKTKQRVVMEFIATANHGGYRPTGPEINEWRTRPDRRRRRRGRLLSPEVPALPERRVPRGPSAFTGIIGTALATGPNEQMFGRLFANTFARAFAGFNHQVTMPSPWRSGLASLGHDGYDTIPGRAGRPAVYAPDKPAEKFLAYLRRLRWIERDSRGGYAVTLLGHALLRAEASADVDDPSNVIAFSAEDELAYGRVLGTIADAGDVLIVDGYLGTQELVHLLTRTRASRFLVNRKLGTRRLTELAIQIDLRPAVDGVLRELRQADPHDRYLIGDQRVYGLGSSLNGIGKKNMTTLVEMSGVVAQTVREHAENLWAAAEFVARTREVTAPEESVDLGREHRPSSRVFVHDGCDVQHRSAETAERCRARRKK